MEFSRVKNILIVLVIIIVLAISVSFFMQNSKIYTLGQITVLNNLSASNTQSNSNIILSPQKLSNPPQIIKSVYVTGYSAGSKKYLNYLSNLFKNTEINAVVVDIKGSDGYISYVSGIQDAQKYKLTNYAISDINALVNFFHNQNIYVIGRIAVFEDPVYSKARPELAIYDKEKTTDPIKPVLWKDNNGLSWLDPASKDVWDYEVSLAKNAFSHGFDEVNFDYVRFPSDGKTTNMGFPVWDRKSLMADKIKEFFKYLRTNLAGEKLSVDLFGQTTVNTDDMGIGQLIENAFENFDYISPMVYPSHYINGFDGFVNPAEHPYEIVKYSMDSAYERELAYSMLFTNSNPAGSSSSESKNIVVPPLAKFRPWLQDFNMGAVYNADMVKAEIKATQDSLGGDYNGFMLWNPLNIYTQEAILKQN